MEGLELIPSHCQESVQEYIEYGIPPGGFLTKVFANDLVGAFGKADDINEAHMRNYAMFLYCHAPTDCWGSYEKVRDWRGVKVHKEQMESTP